MNTYMFDGQMAYTIAGPCRLTHQTAAADLGLMRRGGGRRLGGRWRDSAQRRRLRVEDDDFSQPGILVRDVFDDAQRAALIDQMAGSLLGGVRSPVLELAFGYWKSIDPDVGARIEEKVRAGSGAKPAEGMGQR